MMARFSAIVRVGSMRWPSGVVTGPAVALTDWGLVTLAVRRRMFHQSNASCRRDYCNPFRIERLSPQGSTCARQPSGVGRLGAAGLTDRDVVGILVRMAARLA
jgi:hypothetical protein